MQMAQFARVVKSTLASCEGVLIAKGKEYSTGADKLHNFKKSANMRGCTQAQALGGMMVKHTTSIYDMIESGKDYEIAQWDEKITDHINYLLLLKAIVVEEKNVQTA